MMKNPLYLMFVVLLMSSCSSTQNLYSWYKYDDVTYQYSKKRTDELKIKVLEEYQKMMEKQNGQRGTVPPGLYAEYGYMLYMSGKQDEGLKFMQEEINLYPESEVYISRIIKQLEK